MSGVPICGPCRVCGRRRCGVYQEALRLFCHYLTDPAYGWAAECDRRFGAHPVQVCHE